MSTHSDDPSGEVPEADLVEQLTPLDEEPNDPETATGMGRPSTDDVLANEADVLEQMAPVGDGDDDYPYGSEEE